VKFVRFLMKLIGTLIGFIITIYVVVLYIDLTLKSSVNKKNIERLINNIDLIDDSQLIFNTEDRLIERTINDIKIGNLTYEEKKEILYESKLYKNVQEYLVNYVYYFIGYDDEKYVINEKKKLESKKNIKELIGKKNITLEELENLNIEIDKMYNNLEKINFDSLIDELPKEYSYIIEYINAKEILYIEIVVLVILMILNVVLMKNLSSPFKWTSIGLLFTSIISIGLKFVISSVEINSIIFNKMRETIINTLNTSSYISISLLIFSVIAYVILLINHKNKSEEVLGKTQINIEKVNI